MRTRRSLGARAAIAIGLIGVVPNLGGAVFNGTRDYDTSFDIALAESPNSGYNLDSPEDIRPLYVAHNVWGAGLYSLLVLGGLSAPRRRREENSDN
jgi:hypothetical protein